MKNLQYIFSSPEDFCLTTIDISLIASHPVSVSFTSTRRQRIPPLDPLAEKTLSDLRVPFSASIIVLTRLHFLHLTLRLSALTATNCSETRRFAPSSLSDVLCSPGEKPEMRRSSSIFWTGFCKTMSMLSPFFTCLAQKNGLSEKDMPSLIYY